MSMSLSLGKRGDTIIEVLISIAVIGVVLAGAYATANHSLRDVNDAQEHEQAVVLAQSQLEQLNDATTADLTQINNASMSCYSAAESLQTNLTGYASDCQDYGNTPQDYTIIIKRTINADLAKNIPLDTYEVEVNWYRLGGGNDSVQMFYQPEGS